MTQPIVAPPPYRPYGGPPERRRRWLALLLVWGLLLGGGAGWWMWRTLRGATERLRELPPGVAANGRRAAPVGTLTADVDGDGRGDEVTLLTFPDGTVTWLGFRARLSDAGLRVDWLPVPTTAADVRLAGAADVDGDGRVELVASAASSPGRIHHLWAFWAGELRPVVGDLPLQVRTQPLERTAWGCAGGRLYVSVSRDEGHSIRGLVRYFRLRDGRLVPDGETAPVVPSGRPLPPEMARGVGCPGIAPD